MHSQYRSSQQVKRNVAVWLASFFPNAHWTNFTTAINPPSFHHHCSQNYNELCLHELHIVCSIFARSVSISHSHLMHQHSAQGINAVECMYLSRLHLLCASWAPCSTYTYYVVENFNENQLKNHFPLNFLKYVFPFLFSYTYYFLSFPLLFLSFQVSEQQCKLWACCKLQCVEQTEMFIMLCASSLGVT